MIVHDLLGIVHGMLVDVVDDHQVDGMLFELPELREQLDVGVVIDPVVAVHHLEVQAGSILEPLHDCRAVSAVLLVHRLDDLGMTAFPFLGLLEGAVLRRAIVDDDDLDIGSTAGENRLDAVVHVLCRVVAGNRICNEFVSHQAAFPRCSVMSLAQ